MAMMDRTPTKTMRKAPRRTRPTTPSLVDLCIETLALNIEETSVEALEYLPRELLWRVYSYHTEKCVQTGIKAIRTWRMFSQILLRESSRAPASLYWFDCQNEYPKVIDLPRYVRISTSPNVDFITHLTVHKVWMYQASDLMVLADMPNLGILELSDLFGKGQRDANGVNEPLGSVLGDRLVRGWSEKAKPFPNLRVLLLTSVHSPLTLVTLQYISRFPALVYYNVRSIALPSDDVSVRRTARNSGWRMETTLDPWRATNGRYDHRETRGKVFEGRNRTGHDSNTGVFLSHCDGASTSEQTPDEQTQDITASDVVAWSGAADLYFRDDVYLSFSCNFNMLSLPWMLYLWKLYSALGEQIKNADLLAQGVPLRHRASHVVWTTGAANVREAEGVPVARHEILPPKPMLNVVLGTGGGKYLTQHERPYYGPMDSAQWPNQTRYGKQIRVYTFVREYSPTMAARPSAEVPTRTATHHGSSTKTAAPTSKSTKRQVSSSGSTMKPRKRLDPKDVFR